MLARLGVVPQQLPPADIYPALEKGTIDAAEWIGPYDDEKLGFVKIAPYYYYPGWWEGCANGFLYINSAKWAELPKTYQQMVTTIAGHVAADLIAKYDSRNPPAIERLAAAGATAPVLARYIGCLLQGEPRPVRRGVGQERGLQNLL